MIMELLGKIFGSTHRVKIMRLFLFNQGYAFDADEIIRRARVKKADLRKEISLLSKIGFLKKKEFSKKVVSKKKTATGKPIYTSVKASGWVINQRFVLIEPLRNLLIETDLINEADFIKRIRKTGTIKLLVLSGLFVKDDTRLLDILVVGDNIKPEILSREMSILESEIGRELHYAFFDVQEFRYRKRMYDKLVRDVLENTHIKLVDTTLK